MEHFGFRDRLRDISDFSGVLSAVVWGFLAYFFWKRFRFSLQMILGSYLDSFRGLYLGLFRYSFFKPFLVIKYSSEHGSYFVLEFFRILSDYIWDFLGILVDLVWTSFVFFLSIFWYNILIFFYEPLVRYV